MTDFRRVTDTFSVSPQVSPTDIAEAAAQGYVLIINNRPDGEAPGQPSGAEIKQAADVAGLAYVHIPVAGRPTGDQIDAMKLAIGASGGKVLAFCRSGTRSIVTWALGAPLHRGDLISAGEGAGYDLSSVV